MGVAVFAILALVALQARSGREVAAPALADAAAPGIAVLPFEVRGEDLDVWREGMVDLLSVGLDGAADLRTIDSRTVLARWRELAGSGGADLATSLRVAQATGAHYAILGSIVPIDDDLRLVAEVYDVEGSRRLGQAQVEGSREEILQLIDQLAIRSLGVILERDRNLPEVDLAEITSTSLPAVKEYLGGELHLRRGKFRDAVASYDRAIEADSSFALAWFGLGMALGWLEQSSNPRGFEAMERAVRDPRLPERHEVVARGGYLLDGAVLEPLRLAVRKYPDDARLWYALGEVYFHLPEVGLVGPEEALAAFRRAIELDPGFAPYWIHFIELSFFVDPDSARLRRVIDAYGRMANDNRAHRLAHDLAFGDSESRARARAGLEGVDDEILLVAAFDLEHPRYYRELFPLLDVRLRRAAQHMVPVVLSALGRQSFRAGRVRRALEVLDDPRIEVDPRYMYCNAYQANARGLPVPTSWLDAKFSTVVIDSTALWIGCFGAWAADRAQWERHAQAVSTAREIGRRWLASGDSVGMRQFDAIAQALKGYAEWKHGRPSEALQVLDQARPYIGPYTSDVALPLGWWIGEVLLELGRPAEATPYFRAQWREPLARYELAKIYDQLGEDAKARAEYETFIAGWSDADPELQPVVERARRAMTRLAADRRSRRF
jgi:tetratricopeptide (TPR) repeat protein